MDDWLDGWLAGWLGGLGMEFRAGEGVTRLYRMNSVSYASIWWLGPGQWEWGVRIYCFVGLIADLWMV